MTSLQLRDALREAIDRALPPDVALTLGAVADLEDTLDTLCEDARDALDDTEPAA